MPLQLPDWERGNLKHSPLALAVCQVRFEEVVAVSDSRLMLSIHKDLGGRHGPYPKVERAQEASLEIQLGPGGVVVPQSPTSLHVPGWRLSSADGRWITTIMPTYVSLETKKYTTWSDDFRQRLFQLLDAVAKHIEPSTEQRLGQRYIDRITTPEVTNPQGWKGFIAPELLGPILHTQLGPAINAAQQQIDLDAGHGIRATIRHGFFVDSDRNDALTYLLDFDVFREGICPFDVDDIKTTADAFNRLNVQLFQQTVTDDLLQLLS